MAMQSGFIKRIRDIMRMDAGINGDAQRIEQMVWMLFLKVYDAKEDDWELNEDDYESIIPEDLRWRNWAKADSNGHAMTGDKLLNFVNNTLFPVLKGNDHWLHYEAAGYDGMDPKRYNSRSANGRSRRKSCCKYGKRGRNQKHL